MVLRLSVSDLMSMKNSNPLAEYNNRPHEGLENVSPNGGLCWQKGGDFKSPARKKEIDNDTQEDV